MQISPLAELSQYSLIYLLLRHTSRLDIGSPAIPPPVSFLSILNYRSSVPFLAPKLLLPRPGYFSPAITRMTRTNGLSSLEVCCPIHFA